MGMTADETTQSGERGAYGVRRVLLDMRPYEPGLSAEQLKRERGIRDIAKLGSNESPWGPLPAAVSAMTDALPRLNRYPDGSFLELRSQLASIEGVEPSTIALGNGADSILINLSLALLEPGDEVIYGWPSFITYPLSVRKVGAVPVEVPLDDSYRYDLDAMLAAVTDRTRLVYVCNPNNPTGTYVDRDSLLDFVEQLPEHVLCVVDEAYHEYVTADDYPHMIPDAIRKRATNVMVLRTFSKAYGLAGLRVGWAVAPPEVVRALDTVRGPFELGSLGNVAALASLANRDQIAERVKATSVAREQLTRALREIGLRPIPAAANFVCVPLGDGGNGRAVYERLLNHGIIIRPLDMFGMPDAFRISTGTAAQTERAIEALATVLR